jgi:hypothetical protein
MAATTASKSCAMRWQSLSSSFHLISRHWQRAPLVLPGLQVQGKLTKTVCRSLPAVPSANLCKKKVTARKRVSPAHCFQAMLPDSERDKSGPLYLGGSVSQLQRSQEGRATNVEETLLIRYSSTRMHESLQPFPEESFSSRKARSSIASSQMYNHSSNSLHNQVDRSHVLPSSLCDNASATELKPQSVQPRGPASAPLLGQSSSTELIEALVSPCNSTTVQATDILHSRHHPSEVETLLEQTHFVDAAASCSADTVADGLVRRPINQPRYLCVIDFEGHM